MVLDLYISDGFNAAKETAREFSGPCPACGGKDRFRIWPEENRYWCRRCGVQGDSIQYLRDFHGLSFQEALEFIDSGAIDGHETSVIKESLPPPGKAGPGLSETAAAWIEAIPPDAPPRPLHTLGEPTAVWTYRTLEGRESFHVCRWDSPSGKEIRPLTLWKTKSGELFWAWKHPPQPKPLYHLDRLTARPDAPVLLTEGEKTADAALKIFPEFVSVTSPGGAKAAAKADWSPLKGRTVTIWPDHDQAGRDYAADVARQAHKVGAASVRIVDVPADWPDGWDLADPLPDGETREKLASLIKSARTFEAAPKRINLRRGAEIAALEIKIEWLVEGLIPKQALILLFGRGGIGKTTLALQIAQAIQTGEFFLGLKSAAAQVVYVDYENSLAVLSARLKVAGCSEVLFWPAPDSPARLDQEFQAYFDVLQEYPEAVFIFDTLRSSQGGDENDSQSMEKILSTLRRLRDQGATVIILHHTRKGSDATYKGSTAIFDLVDQVLGLYAVKGQGQDQEANEDSLEDDRRVYRFGTHNKTRFEPYKFYLSFDPVTRLFVPAPDPTTETLEAIRELVPDGGLIQKNLLQTIKKELNLSKDKALALLKRGEGEYWTVQVAPAKNNQKTYTKVFRFSAPCIGSENQKTAPDRPQSIQNTDGTQNQKTITNTWFSGFRPHTSENQENPKSGFPIPDRKTDPRGKTATGLLDLWTGPAEMEV